MELALLLAVAAVMLFVLSPVAAGALLGWRRRRRAEATLRQIALTDAIDAQLGPLVAPVVTDSWWGPWRVQISGPCGRPATLGRVLALTHETLAAVDGGSARRYRIVLTARPDPAPDAARPASPGRGWRARRAAA